MNALFGTLAILFMAVVLPLVIIMHYVTKWKSTKGLTNEEQRMLEELWESSERLHARLATLETILDGKSSKWRNDE